jgi:hypothetical protein
MAAYVRFLQKQHGTIPALTQTEAWRKGKPSKTFYKAGATFFFCAPKSLSAK